MRNLDTKIGKVTIRNPLILAAGVLGSTYSTLNKLYNEGLGAVTTKSIGLYPRSGHPNPSVLYLSEIKSVINAIGLANPGVEYFCKELINIEAEVKFVISCFASSPDEFVQVLNYIERETQYTRNPIAFELNLSCPHAKNFGMAVGTDSEIVKTIVEAAKQSTKKPIWVKLTPNVENITQIGIAAIEGGADAIVAINTLKALLIDLKTKKPILANRKGGLSGAAIKPIGLRAIFDLYECLGSDVPLIGVGGISSGEDIIEYILAGANAVQIGSVFSYNDSKSLIKEFITSLDSFLEAENISLTELRGLAHE
jgi:dihydroorotate dehydrogenase (NAD+) catalytic subunit